MEDLDATLKIKFSNLFYIIMSIPSDEYDGISLMIN